MIPGRLPQWTITIVLTGVVSVSQAGHALTPSAGSCTDEILRLVPRDMAACLIIEDIAGHYRSFVESPCFERMTGLPVVTDWLASPEYRKLVAARQFLASHFGVAADELRDGLLGQSVVLAFRPRTKSGAQDVGVFFCRARDESFAAEVIQKWNAMTPRGRAERLSYRDIDFYRREKANGQTDCALQLGPVLVACEQRETIERVIDTFRDTDRSTALHPFQQIRETLPAGCLAQVILLPRPFDPHIRDAVARARGPEAVFAQTLEQFWSMAEWGAWTARFDGNATLEFHLSMDAAQLPDALKRWGGLPEPHEFWSRIPEQTLAAAAGRVDFVQTGKFIHRVLSANENPDLRMLASIFSQLLAGYDVRDDLIPRIGPSVGVLATRSAENGMPALLATVQLQDRPPSQSGQLPLSVALESALRPLLVVIGAESNKDHQDQMRATMDIMAGHRIHYLTGSTKLPDWVKPAFAVGDQVLLLGTSPAAVANWWSTSGKTPIQQSAIGQLLADAGMSETFRLRAYANVTAMRSLVELHRNAIVHKLAQNNQRKAESIDRRLDILLSLFSPLDRILVGVQQSGNVHRWTVTLLPVSGE